VNAYLDLYTSFFRIGAFTFGGGYAMLPMIQKEIVEKHKWASDEEVMDYFAVAQCTPGVISVNCATFVGTKVKGALGAAAATFGVISPPLIIISIIALVLQSFADLPVVQHAFNGIRVAVCVLILNAVIKLWKSNIKKALHIIVFGVAFVIMFLVKLSPIFYVVVAAIVGILDCVIARNQGRKAGKDA